MFAELDDFDPGDALAQAAQYHNKQEDVFTFVFEFAFIGSAAFRY